MKKEASLYFHIGNGGVSVAVENTVHGPLLKMEARHFGHPTGSVGVHIQREEFARLSEFFADMAKEEFQPPYVCVAEGAALYVDGERKSPPRGGFTGSGTHAEAQQRALEGLSIAGSPLDTSDSK